MKFILDIKINGLVQKEDIATKIYYTASTKIPSTKDYLKHLNRNGMILYIFFYP
jgi:hypothetical protein